MVKHEARQIHGSGSTNTDPKATTQPNDQSASETTQEKPKEKSSFRQSLSNFFTPPAKKSYNKVLAASYQKESNAPYQQRSALSSVDSLAKEKEEVKELTDEEKAKRLVAERDASSPTGNFMLGVYRPLSTTQGYGDYYTAKGMTGK